MPSGAILQVNQAFTDVTGYTAEDIVGQTPRILKSGKQDTGFYRNMWEALAHEGCWSGDIWNRRKDGGIYPEWLSISGIKTPPARSRTIWAHTLTSAIPRKPNARLSNSLSTILSPGLPNRRLLLDRLNARHDHQCSRARIRRRSPGRSR